MTEVLIAIQARSSSKRLPGKSLMDFDGMKLIEYVHEQARLACSHINKNSHFTQIRASVALLIPVGDPIKEAMAGNMIIEGPEDDVLRRYEMACNAFYPDYVVRLTGDCPQLIPTIITKHITSAVGFNLDYCSNTFDDLRTYEDGLDCEVLSKKAFEYIIRGATSDYDKEHVTTFIKRTPPKWVKFGAILGHRDQSHIKSSVDTQEEFDQAEKLHISLKEKINLAKDKGYAIFRF